jgi:hypothetical protein
MALRFDVAFPRGAAAPMPPPPCQVSELMGVLGMDFWRRLPRLHHCGPEASEQALALAGGDVGIAVKIIVSLCCAGGTSCIEPLPASSMPASIQDLLECTPQVAKHVVALAGGDVSRAIQILFDLCAAAGLEG